MSSMNDKNIFEKIRQVVSSLLPAVMVLMVVLSFTLSVVSISRVNKVQRDVSAMSVEFASAVSSLQKTNKELHNTLDAIEGHLAFLDKYMSDHYSFFYGNDRVNIDVRNSNKSTKK